MTDTSTFEAPPGFVPARFAEFITNATDFTFLPAGAVPGERELYLYSIKVSWRGPDSWAVLWMDECWGADGWGYEPMPSNRTDNYLSTHRFQLDEAVAIARANVDSISINGRTWAQLQEWRQERAG